MTHDENFSDAMRLHELDKYRISQDAETERQRIQVEGNVARVRAQQKTARNNALGVFFGFVGAAILVGVIAFFIWNGTKGPSADDILIQERSTSCIEAGGTWVDGVTGRDTDQPGMCIARGASVE